MYRCSQFFLGLDCMISLFYTKFDNPDYSISAWLPSPIRSWLFIIFKGTGRRWASQEIVDILMRDCHVFCLDANLNDLLLLFQCHFYLLLDYQPCQLCQEQYQLQNIPKLPFMFHDIQAEWKQARQDEQPLPNRGDGTVLRHENLVYAK